MKYNIIGVDEKCHLYSKNSERHTNIIIFENRKIKPVQTSNTNELTEKYMFCKKEKKYRFLL